MVAQPMYTADPVELYCAHLRNLGRADGTVNQYGKVLVLAERELGHELMTASPAELRRLFTMSPWVQGLGLRAKKAAAGLVVAYLEWAVEEELLEGPAPVGPLRKWAAELGRPEQTEVTFLTIAELELLERGFWEHSRHAERDVAILWVLAGAGGRITETLQLRRNDVSLTDQVIRFRHHTKGRRKRTVPMTPRTRDALRRWLKVRLSPTDWLFMTWTHKPVDGRSWEEKLDRVARLAGLQWAVCPAHGERACEPGREAGQCPRAGWRVHPHTLRHSFAVEALRSGACSLVELRDILGHSNISTTNIYANVVQDETATNRFKRRFGKGG